MPGANCPIFGCGVSRKPKYQGIGIFKIPPSAEKNNQSWRKALLHVLTRDRVVDASFRKQIEEGSVLICERHFTPEDIEIRKFQSFSYLFLYKNNLFGSFEAEIFEVVDYWVFITQANNKAGGHYDPIVFPCSYDFYFSLKRKLVKDFSDSEVFYHVN